MSSTSVPVTVPEGLGPGSTIAVVHNGNQVVVTIPEGVRCGDVFHVSVPSEVEELQIAQAVAVPTAGATGATQAEAVPAGGGVHAVPVNGFSRPEPYQVHTNNTDLQYAEKLLRSRSWISCWALFDIFLIILSLYRVGMWGLVLLIGPLFGYYGARSLSSRNILIYFIFKIAQTIIYFVDMLAADNSSDFVWSLLLVLCEVYITQQVYQFYKMLLNIDEGALMRAMSQLQNQPMNSYY